MKKAKRLLLIIICLLLNVGFISITKAPVSAAVTESSGVSADVGEPTGAVSSVRQRIINYMTSMATVKWTCSKGFSTGTTINGNWVRHDIYYAGNQYYGIPYDQEWGTNGLITLGKFNTLIEGGKTISGRIGRNDCSYAVCQSIRQVDGNLDINSSSTADIYPGANHFVKVGSYTYSSNKAATCSANGKSVMVAAYKQLQPGDCVCSDGHAMLVVGNNGKTGITVTHQNSYPYKYDPNTQTSTFINDNERKPPRNSSWQVNGSCSYDDLFAKNYIPLKNKVVALSDATPTNAVDLGTNFYANIVVTSNTNLAVAANSSANVLLATKANNNSQKWLFERDTDKSYRVTNVGTNKCLDVSGGKGADKTNIGVYANNNKTNQRWYFVKDGSGYTIVPKSSTSSAMDIKDGNIANGSDIWQYTRNQSNAQRFSVVNKANRYYIAYNANGGTGTMSSAAIGAEETLKIANCGFTRDGCLFGGYNVFRSSDSKWYVTGEGWKSNAEINAGGFTKAVYKPGETYKITGIWNSGVPAGTTYTFYPIWLLNNPKLWCYLSYSGCNYMLGSDLGDEYEAYIKSGNTSAFTVEKDESVRLNNQNSLKITVLSDDTQNNTVRFFTSTNSGRNTGSNGLFPEAGENKKYTLNFWAKSTVKNANMTLRWGWEANTRTAKLDSEWKFYSIPMNKNCNFDRCIHCNIDKKGTVWLNNLTLTVGAEGAPESYRHETECTPIVQTYTHGGKYSTLPEPEREGYTFLGWFTQPEGGTPITTNTNVVDYNAAVYAHWQKNVSDEPVQTAKSGNKRYELYDNNVTWEEAKEFCESKGGHLATVNSVEENALVASMIADKRCTVWLGAKLNESTNDWEWVTGEEFSCINWAAGKPSANSDSVYAQMIAFDTGLSAVAGCWNDQPNGSNIRNLYCKENCLFVCEYDVVPGDANGDGKVNIRDVTAIQRHVSELKLLAGKDAFSADVDGNGAVDINDATHLQRYLAEYDVQLG